MDKLSIKQRKEKVKMGPKNYINIKVSKEIKNC